MRSSANSRTVRRRSSCSSGRSKSTRGGGGGGFGFLSIAPRETRPPARRGGARRTRWRPRPCSSRRARARGMRCRRCRGAPRARRRRTPAGSGPRGWGSPGGGSDEFFRSAKPDSMIPAIRVVQRPDPDVVAARLPGSAHLLGPGIVVPEGARIVVAHGQDHGPRQRGEVEQVRGARLTRVPEGVGEDQTGLRRRCS